MTNKIMLGLSLLLMPIFSSIGMENSKRDKIVREITEHRTRLINRIATCAALKHDTDGQDKYQTMRNFIVSKAPESDSAVFFNEVAEVIVYELGRSDIFSDELQWLFTESKTDHESVDIFFNEFCPRLQCEIVMSMIRELKTRSFEESISEECMLAGNILSYLVKSSENIQVICSLATKLRKLKDNLLIKSFRALNPKKQNGFTRLTYSELINLPLFKLLTESCNTVSKIALKHTKVLEKKKAAKGSDKLLEHVSLTKEAADCFCYLFSNDQAVPDKSERHLSANERASIGRYLFLEYFVIFPELLSSSGNINLQLSTIYDNTIKPLHSLRLNGWQKRIDDLMDICRIADIVNPSTYALSKYIDNPELLGPRAKCMHYVNNQITQCVAARAIENLIKAVENQSSGTEIEDIAKDFEFLLKNLDRVFFKKCLRLVSSELKAVINIIPSTHTNKLPLELVDIFYDAIDLLNMIMPSIEPNLLDFARQMCEETNDYVDQKFTQL